MTGRKFVYFDVILVVDADYSLYCTSYALRVRLQDEMTRDLELYRSFAVGTFLELEYRHCGGDFWFVVPSEIAALPIAPALSPAAQPTAPAKAPGHRRSLLERIFG
jgi:hypothetical protein